MLNAAGWLQSERWDIDLKTTAPAGWPQREQMFQTLLADRFRLKYHRETRTLPVYSLLLVAKGDPKLQKPQGDHPEGFSTEGIQ